MYRYTFVLYSGYNQYIFVLFLSTGLDEISPRNPSSNDHDLQTPTGRIDLGIGTGLCQDMPCPPLSLNVESAKESAKESAINEGF